MFLAVDKLAAELAEAPITEHYATHWEVKVLGGGWTTVHKGVAFDAIRGEPRTTNAETWASSVGLAKSGARFSVRDFTVRGARIAAEFYCMKCQWYFDQSGGEARLPPGVTIPPCPEPEAFVDLVAELAGEASKRAQ